MPPGGGIFLSYNRETGKAPQGTASSTTANEIKTPPSATFSLFFPRRVLYPVNSAARGPALPKPVGDGVLDVPP